MVACGRMSEGRHVVLFAEDSREWAALVVDGRLEDLFAEDSSRYAGPRRGEVCVARVDRLAAGGRVAFLDLGGNRTGFLGRATGHEEGDLVLVQVDRYAFENKAARVSEAVSVPGRWSVVISGGDGVAVSRRIADEEERDRLRDAIESYATDVRIVLRTAAENVDEDDLVEEVDFLLERLDDFREQASVGEPRTILEAPGPVQRALVDWPVQSAVQVTGAGGSLDMALGGEEPDGMIRLQSEDDLLDLEDLDSQFRSLLHAKVDLAGGGWIAVEPTAALVAIDVNAGSGELERRSTVEVGRVAAREIPRQLRLRGLAGIVVVDFPHGSDTDDERIEREIIAALRRDPAGGRAYGWTEAGLYEISRRKDRRPVQECFTGRL